METSSTTKNLCLILLDLIPLYLYNGYMTKRKSFWSRFDELFDDFFGEEINNSTTIKQTSYSKGSKNVSIIGNGNKIRSVGSNSSSISQDGYDVLIQTKNKEIIITVNGKTVFKEKK